jgi:HK97 gp10 family phage protein
MARKAGFQIVFNRIPQVIAEVEANAQRTVAKVADAIAEDARGHAPVRTGRLRSSIEGRPKGKQADIAVDADYAAFVEFGTYKMAAKPFLTPAVSEHQDEFFDGKNYFPKGS